MKDLFDLDLLRARAIEVRDDQRTPETERKEISEFLDAWERADVKDYDD